MNSHVTWVSKPLMGKTEAITDSVRSPGSPSALGNPAQLLEGLSWLLQRLQGSLPARWAVDEAEAPAPLQGSPPSGLPSVRLPRKTRLPLPAVELTLPEVMWAYLGGRLPAEASREALTLGPPPGLTPRLCPWPTGFLIYFGYGLWHSEEATLAADASRTPDGHLDHCK